MASPQKENGYIPIANELAEQLMKINLNGYQSRLLWAIWRKTYGYNKKKDWISTTQLCELTGLRKQHVSRTKKELIQRKIVTSLGYKIQFNKDYSQWTELPKKVTVTNPGYSSNQSRLKSNQSRGTQKTITKDNTSSIKIEEGDKSPVSYGNKDINSLLEAVKEMVGVEDFVDSQRWARIYAKHCLNLIKKIGGPEFRRRLESLLDDPFTAKNCNKIRFIYQNIKGFKEPTDKDYSITL